MSQNQETHGPKQASARVNELSSAPDWLVGLWRRESIELQDGTIDRTTRVFWAQTLNLFVDIRIPIDRPERPGCLGSEDFTLEELLRLCEQRAFAGHTIVKDDTCTWIRLIDYQPDTGRPDSGRLRLEDGILHEVGGANTVTGMKYHEIYHRDVNGKERRVALRLESCAGHLFGERSPSDAILVILDDCFVFARARSCPLEPAETLRALVARADGDRAAIEGYLDCEVSIGSLGGDAQAWEIDLSTLPWREKRRLFPRGHASIVPDVDSLHLDTPAGWARWRVFDSNLGYEMISDLLSS